MTERITACLDTLMRQAPMTAGLYMQAAIDDIDGTFGKGYAKANPELVGSYMKASAMDLCGSIIAQQVRAGLSEINLTS